MFLLYSFSKENCGRHVKGDYDLINLCQSCHHVKISKSVLEKLVNLILDHMIFYNTCDQS
mgnify:CR=1 FL=1